MLFIVACAGEFAWDKGKCHPGDALDIFSGAPLRPHTAWVGERSPKPRTHPTLPFTGNIPLKLKAYIPQPRKWIPPFKASLKQENEFITQAGFYSSTARAASDALFHCLGLGNCRRFGVAMQMC